MLLAICIGLLSVLLAPIFFILLCIAGCKKEESIRWGKIYHLMIIGLIFTVPVALWLFWAIRGLHFEP